MYICTLRKAFLANTSTIHIYVLWEVSSSKSQLNYAIENVIIDLIEYFKIIFFSCLTLHNRSDMQSMSIYYYYYANGAYDNNRNESDSNNLHSFVGCSIFLRFCSYESYKPTTIQYYY